MASPVIEEVSEDGGEISCKPWVPRNGRIFTKVDFRINMRDRTIACPVGHVELGYDEIKPHLLERNEAIRSRTTADVRQGLWAIVLSDNLVPLARKLASKCWLVQGGGHDQSGALDI